MENYGIQTYFGDGRVDLQTDDTLGVCWYISRDKYSSYKLPQYRKRFFVCVTPVLSKIRQGNAEWAFPNYSVFYSSDENTVVVNIACGLDTRCYRMKGKYLRWYNVDLPETMKIRSQFLTETDPVYQIAKSAMDDSYVDDIDYHCENVLVIIEGLTMYLCEKDIRKMFFIIEKSFQEVTVMVETMSPFVVKHVKEKSIEGSNAKFTWGVKNGTELQRIVPGFSVQQEVSLVEGMKKLIPIYHVIGKIQIVRNISNKIIVLEKLG